MTWIYGTTTNANIEKDLQVTANKFKIQVTMDIWLAGGSTHECYISVHDSTGAIIQMNDFPSGGYDGTFGNFVGFSGGVNHKVFILERTSGVAYTVGEILTIRCNTTPWATTNPMYFYELKFELVD